MHIHFGGDDQQRSIKEHLLVRIGLSRSIDLMRCPVDEMVKVARIACLNGMELYFGIENIETPINPRNEAAALSFLLHELTRTSGLHLQNTIPGVLCPEFGMGTMHTTLIYSGAEQGKEDMLARLTAAIDAHELNNALPCSRSVPVQTSISKDFQRYKNPVPAYALLCTRSLATMWALAGQVLTAGRCACMQMGQW